MPRRSLWEAVPPSRKVLFYLHELQSAQKWAGKKTGDRDATQEAIAAALGISVPRLSKVMAPLSGSGTLIARRGRVPGKRRSPLVYSLSPQGFEMARRLLQELLSKKVNFTNSRGETTEMTLSRLGRTFNLEGNLPALLRAAGDDSAVSARTIREAMNTARPERGPRPGLIDPRNALQVPPGFVGRASELARLGEFLSESPSRIFLLTGSAAIGKTSLVSKFALDVSARLPVAFHTCREWDTVRTVLEGVSDLLSRQGQNRLKYTLFGEQKQISIPEVAQILETDLARIECLIVIDDIQKLTFDYRPLVKVFLKQSVGPAPTDNRAKLIATSRDPLTGLADARDSVLKGALAELELSGLSVSETRELLSRDGRSLSARKVYRITGGHPLHIELILHSGLRGGVKGFSKFLSQEILSKLAPGERSVLGCLSVLGISVPKTAVKIAQSSDETFERLEKLGLAKAMEKNHYLVPDIIREIVLRSLPYDEKRLYHKVAATYHENRKSEDRTAFAIDHLILADDILRALELALSNAVVLIRTAQRAILERLLVAARGADLAPAGEVAASRLRAELAMASGDFRLAQLLLEKAYRAVRGDPVKEMGILAQQGEAFRERSLFARAFGKLETALRIASRLYDLKALGLIFRAIGKTHIRRGELEKAREPLKKSLDFLRAADMEMDYAETLIDLAILEDRLGNNLKAIGFSRRAIERLKPGGWKSTLTRAYNNLGVSYYMLRRYALAIQYWRKAYSLSRRNGNKRGMIIALTNMADPLARKKNFRQALAGLRIAQALVSETDDVIGLFQVNYCYGLVYSRMKRADVAFEYFRQGEKIAHSHGMKYELGSSYFEHAKALADAGRQIDALQLLEKSRNLFRSCCSKKEMEKVEDLLRKLSMKR